jgi:hypothetical protein
MHARETSLWVPAQWELRIFAELNGFFQSRRSRLNSLMHQWANSWGLLHCVLFVGMLTSWNFGDFVGFVDENCRHFTTFCWNTVLLAFEWTSLRWQWEWTLKVGFWPSSGLMGTAQTPGLEWGYLEMFPGDSSDFSGVSDSVVSIIQCIGQIHYEFQSSLSKIIQSSLTKHMTIVLKARLIDPIRLIEQMPDSISDLWRREYQLQSFAVAIILKELGDVKREILGLRVYFHRSVQRSLTNRQQCWMEFCWFRHFRQFPRCCPEDTENGRQRNVQRNRRMKVRFEELDSRNQQEKRCTGTTAKEDNRQDWPQ